ncbi:proline-rich extensin-like protein EPR1 [Ostrinia furnacalis]|uniref:proline-rich extensin-like protein EPR1 n=1 Tax=Ostrinia furnacalis TaxID=93504 RepID=UPI00103AF4CB|nr:proline-rich extensin-like protein EPR1 [Ostrinia furnacalis]
MDSRIPILLLSLCACASSEPLPDALQRRSGHGVYASEYSRGYQPLAYAAIPLHAPIPVLHVLTPAQNPDQERAQSVNRPNYAQPQQSVNRPTYALPQQSVNRPAYPQPQQSINRPTYALPQQYLPQQYVPRYGQPNGFVNPYSYASSMSYLMYTNPPEEPEESAPPTILYARPNPNGGYTYRRRPNKNRTAPKKPPNEPVIIKIHKYRVVRDR